MKLRYFLFTITLCMLNLVSQAQQQGWFAFTNPSGGNTGTSILTFSHPKQVSSTMTTQKWSVLMPVGYDLSSMIFNYTTSPGASVLFEGFTRGGFAQTWAPVAQTSGVNANNCGEDWRELGYNLLPMLNYKVTSTSGSNANWTVTASASTLGNDIIMSGTSYGPTYKPTGDMFKIQPTVASTVGIYDCSFVSLNSNQHMILLGAESTFTSMVSKSDGANILGNYFEWPGTDITDDCEAVLTGYNKNTLAKYNYVKNCPYGLPIKSNGQVSTYNSVSYNVFVGTYKVGCGSKGTQGVKFYNNTFYNTSPTAQVMIGCIYINSNTDSITPGYAATNCEIYNNIFYTVNQKANIYCDANSLTGLKCDYNVYWCEAGTPVFRISGATITFAQWQAMGYDTHSVVMNPGFKDFVGCVPNAPLNYGKDLGEYQLGMSITNKAALGQWDNRGWLADLSIFAPQGIIKQCGAYVVPTVTITPGDYYVSPTGNDANAGTMAAPFKTIEKAYSVAVAGNLIYFRGGHYYPKTTNLQVPINLNTGRNGTSGNLIKFWAYPGETPVIDFSTINYPTNTATIWALLFTGNYWHWKGFEVTGFPQITWLYVHSSFLIRDCNNCIFENFVIHDNYSMGLSLGGNSTGNLVLNCDAYNNHDPESTTDPNGNADGIHMGVITNETGYNTVRGCRSWNNSDDGYDCYSSTGLVYFDHCWAWHNGYELGTDVHAGDGVGFKLGGCLAAYTTVKRQLNNCVAWKNYMNGFDQNFDSGDPFTFPSYLYNCTSWANGTTGFIYGVGFKFGKNNDANILQNCVSYGDYTAATMTSATTHNHNSWDIPLTISSTSFTSLDWSNVTGARNTDYSLPTLQFLHPTPSTSPLLNAGLSLGYGVNVGAF